MAGKAGGTGIRSLSAVRINRHIDPLIGDMRFGMTRDHEDASRDEKGVIA